MAAILDVITDAFTELGVVAAADTLSADDAALGLSRLNDLLDEWNADRRAVYSEQFASYTLTANLTPHTIGPTGATFTVTQRPVSVEAANIIDTSVTPNVTISRLTLRDAEWWANQPVQNLTSTVSTDLYYDPAWPNGNLYFWPTPTTAYTVQLFTRVLLAEVTLATTFTLPPGYKKAITLTLAEDLAAPLNVPVKPSTVRHAQQARARIFSNNLVVPSLQTSAYKGSSSRSDFNWRTGMVNR